MGTWNFSMSNNKITTITSKQLPPAVQEFRSLGNPLTSISDDAFADSSDLLDTLVIMNSDLTALPKAIGSLTSLTTLYVSYNDKLTDAGTTSFPATIIDLYLNSNALTSLPDKSFEALPLRTFHVEFNKIKSLDNVVFPTALKSLEAYNNDIETIFSLKFFANNNNNNGGTASTSSPQLESLDLFNNPIKSIAKYAFASLTKLTSLSLSGTRLTRLPLAWTQLPELVVLDAAYIPTLVCTCEESTVAAWYHNRTSLRIDGKCGVADITYFFNSLAPLCPPQPI